MQKFIVDYREHELINSVSSDDFIFETSNLTIGDIHIYKNDKLLIIERKTLNDLSSSIIDGRYNEQKHRLLQSGAQIVYIIEGLSKNNYGVPLTTLYSIMYTLQVRDKIIVLRSNSLEETISLITMLGKKFDESKEIQQCYNATIIRKSSSHDVYLSMLCCIPGVSQVIGKKIQSYFASFSELIDHINKGKTLVHIDKIGNKLSQKIISHLVPDED